MPKAFEETLSYLPSRTSKNSEKRRFRGEEDGPFKKQKTNDYKESDSSPNIKESQDEGCHEDCAAKVKVDLIKTFLEMEDLNKSIDKNSSIIKQLKEILYYQNDSSEECIKKEKEEIKQEPISEAADPVKKKTPVESKGKNPCRRKPRNKEINQTKCKGKEAKTSQVMNCFLCAEKEGRNMTNPRRARYHMTVCVLKTGGYASFIPHKQGEGVEISM